MTTITQLYNNLKTFVLQVFESKEDEDTNLPIDVENRFQYIDGKMYVLNTPPMILKFTGQTLTQYTSNALIGDNIVIDYGDGNIVAYNGNYSHTYDSSDNYIIKMYGVTGLGDDCFTDCTGLTSVTLPNSVTSLGDYCFYYCTGLTSITIPSNVTSLGYCCFDSCTGLTSITIPSNVTSLGYYCFGYCSNLAHIYLNWTSTDIITYNSTWITDAYSGLIFNVPSNTKSAYINKGYPSDKLLEAGD